MYQPPQGSNLLSLLKILKNNLKVLKPILFSIYFLFFAFGRYYARLGDLDYTTEDDKASPVDYLVEETIPHSGYTKKPMVNDIALLKLMNTVEYTGKIKDEYYESIQLIVIQNEKHIFQAASMIR